MRLRSSNQVGSKESSIKNRCFQDSTDFARRWIFWLNKFCERRRNDRDIKNALQTPQRISDEGCASSFKKIFDILINSCSIVFGIHLNLDVPTFFPAGYGFTDVCWKNKILKFCIEFLLNKGTINDISWGKEYVQFVQVLFLQIILWKYIKKIYFI